MYCTKCTDFSNKESYFNKLARLFWDFEKSTSKKKACQNEFCKFWYNRTGCMSLIYALGGVWWHGPHRLVSNRSWFYTWECIKPISISASYWRVMTSKINATFPSHFFCSSVYLQRIKPILNASKQTWHEPICYLYNVSPSILTHSSSVHQYLQKHRNAVQHFRSYWCAAPWTS